jgi:O-antigen ligase
MKNPLAGVGAGCYSPATTAYSGVYTGVAHNQVILVLVELGIVGLVLYLAFVYFVFRAAWSMPRREKLLWIGMLSVWFLESMAISSQVDKLAWMLWALALCQAAILARSRAGRRLPNGPGMRLPAVGPPPRWRKA